MSKGGILTACRVNNNGTDLQCVAMYHLFSQYFCDIEVIDYVSPFLERSRQVFKSWTLKDILRVSYYLYMNIAHSSFRKKHLRLSKHIYSSLTGFLDNYSFVIVGSDQVWNIDITHDINFFLPASSHTSKLSYAVSFGRNDLSAVDNNFSISKYLKDFEFVSVRENSAVLALSKIEVESQEDLDPILMVGKKYLLTLFKNKPPRHKYVLLYAIESKKEIIDFAKKRAKNLKCKVIMICPPTFPKKGITIKSFVSISRWLNFVFNAECIITDSYHCVSTAIAFEKELHIFDLDSKDKNTRTDCLLKKLGAKKTISIKDYIIINKKLNVLKDKSFKYIQEIGAEYGN